eukprot:1061997-Pyramimonas_sp.AAC.1
MAGRLSLVRSSKVPRRATSIRSDIEVPLFSMLVSSTTMRSASGGGPQLLGRAAEENVAVWNPNHRSRPRGPRQN